MASTNPISILISAKDDASRVLRSLRGELDDTTGAAGRTGAIMGGALRLGAIAGAAGVTAFGAASVVSLKQFGDYQQSLSVLRSVSGATTAQMQVFAATAKQLGNDITLPGLSAKDAAFGMVELAKAGLSVNDTLAASKGVLSLAKAGQLEVADAAQVTARALNAFQLSGDQATKIADLLAAAANASTASVGDMALGLQMVGAQAHQMRVPLQDTVAALALFSNAGINGSDAGTSLKQMFLQLLTPTRAAADIMKDLGLKFFNAKGQFIGLSAMSEMLRVKLAGLNDEQRNTALATIFGSDATRVASILAQSGAAGFDKMAVAVNRQGAAAALSAAQNSGLKGALDNLKSNVETLAIDFGEKLAPFVQRVAMLIANDLHPAAAAAWRDFKQFVDVLREVVAVGREAAGQLAVLWDRFVNSTPIIILAQFFQQVFVPAVQALWAAFVQNLLPALDQLWTSVTRLWAALNPALTDALKIIGAVLGAVLLVAIWAVLSALNILVQVLSMVVTAISNVINWVSNLINWFGNVAGVVINIGRIIVTVFANLPMALKDVLGPVYDVVTAPFQAAYNFIVGLFNRLPGVVRASISASLRSIPVIGPVANAASFIKNALPGFASGGYTGSGSDSAIAGVVHKGEYVLPKQAVDQSTGLPKQSGGGNVFIDRFVVNNDVDPMLVTRQIGWALATR